MHITLIHEYSAYKSQRAFYSEMRYFGTCVHKQNTQINTNGRLINLLTSLISCLKPHNAPHADDTCDK